MSANSGSSFFDYVIVGGGSAGCVLANRLSARGSNQVLLIEAGSDTPPGDEPADILSAFPISYSNPEYRWPGLRGHMLTADDSELRGLAQARILGGGSAIMGMMSFRGLPADYEAWAEMGAAGWDWNGVLPYFRKLESDLDFDGPLHGKDGPTEICRIPRRDWPPLSNAAAAFAASRQLPEIGDFNADFRDGHGAIPIAASMTRRAAASVCYLTADVRSRPNLTLLTGARATELLFEGSKVTGVVVSADGRERTVHASEVILAMGGLLSPQFLLRQGLGPAAAMRSLDMAPRADLPGVGANLQNHAGLGAAAYLRPLGRQSRDLPTMRTICFRYSSGAEGCGEVDMMLAFGSRSSWHAISDRVAHFGTSILAPKSRGKISLQSPRPSDPVRVEYNLLGDERDLTRLMSGLARIAELVASGPVSPLLGRSFPVRQMGVAERFDRRSLSSRAATPIVAAAMDLLPGVADRIVGVVGGRGPDLQDLVQDSSALRSHVRASVLGAAHHAGACRMGAKDDEMAVVDRFGKVRKVGGLRVIDASIIPTIPRANTNIPVLMLAEKLSDEMLQGN
jgi:5-(hydroxymethyl)furfural/furfural oxidase